MLLTVSGELVSYVAQPARCKDDIRVIAGLASEVWQETRDHGSGMVDSEYGRVVVVPVDNEGDSPVNSDGEDEYQPLMLLAVNALDTMDWEDIQERGAACARLIARPLGRFRHFLTTSKSTPPTPSGSSPSARP